MKIVKLLALVMVVFAPCRAAFAQLPPITPGTVPPTVGSQTTPADRPTPRATPWSSRLRRR